MPSIPAVRLFSPSLPLRFNSSRFISFVLLLLTFWFLSSTFLFNLFLLPLINLPLTPPPLFSLHLLGLYFFSTSIVFICIGLCFPPLFLYYYRLFVVSFLTYLTCYFGCCFYY